jgi:hypothetical protein
MASMNVTHFPLLGLEVSFRDLAFEQKLSKYDFPPDYPEEFKSSIVTGTVTEFCFTVGLDGRASTLILVSDTYYDLSELAFIPN